MSEIVYGIGLYTSDIKKHAKEYLAVLPKEVTLLVSMGSSGCAIASAMLTLSRRKLEHLQYRKPQEDAHSKHCICPSVWKDNRPKPNTNVALVDDFITIGKTMACLVDKATGDKLNIKAIIISKIWWSYEGNYESKISRYNVINLEQVAT